MIKRRRFGDIDHGSIREKKTAENIANANGNLEVPVGTKQ
jgi:hypothetical protein